VRAVSSVKSTGGIAFNALLVFIVLLYANPGNWFDEVPDIGYAKIAAGCALLALGGSWLLYNHRISLGGLTGVALIGLYFLVGFSASWSYWPSASVDTFLEAVKYFAIFFVAANVVDSKPRLHYFLSTMALASLIPAFGTIHSWVTGQHLVDGDRVGWIGIFANPNDLAYHLVVGVALVLCAREAASRRRMKLVYLLALIPIGTAIVLTQSRGGMLACGAALVLWVLRSVRRAPAALGVAVALACVSMLGPANIFEHRMESAQAFGTDMSAQGRIDAWRTGMNIAAARPLTGVGAGAFVVAWPDFAPGDAGPARTEHNTFVQLVAEIGIPALCFFVLALVAGALGVSRATRTADLASYARGVQCGLAAFAVCSVWGGIAFSWPVYLLLGASVAIRRLAAEEEVPVADVARARHRLAEAV
jgi:O-antigen ligase